MVEAVETWLPALTGSEARNKGGRRAAGHGQEGEAVRPHAQHVAHRGRPGGGRASEGLALGSPRNAQRPRVAVQWRAAEREHRRGGRRVEARAMKGQLHNPARAQRGDFASQVAIDLAAQ